MGSYLMRCSCRKRPEAGILLQAAGKHASICPTRSFGDMVSDMLACIRAGAEWCVYFDAQLPERAAVGISLPTQLDVMHLGGTRISG
jgi:histidinol phosphatase-like enzyme